MNHADLHTPAAEFTIKQCIAAGDERALRQLFDFYSKRLVHFAFSMLKSRDAALEVVDEAFIKLWKQKEKVTDIGNLRIYLYTAVKNTALNYLSKKAREQITEPFDFIDVAVSDQYSPEKQLITAEIFNQIQAVVEALPARCKMVFRLVREDGLKYKEVAAILNISVNTVDAQMVIAVKRISEKLSPALDLGLLHPEKKS